MVEANNTIQVIEESTRVPTEDEVREYAEFLGIDPEHEPYLMWIAREGIVAPVPQPWKACTENADDVFYFNFETGESVWDHPCDAKYRQLVEQHRNIAKQDSMQGEEPGGNGLRGLTRQREVIPSNTADNAKLDEVILAADAVPSCSPDVSAGAIEHLGPLSASGPGQNRLDLITKEISEDDSDSDVVAVDVLDVEVTDRDPEGAEAVKALCCLADRHKDQGAAADRKETLQRALALVERAPTLPRDLLHQVLRGLAEAHNALGEAEAERRMLARIASLNGVAGGSNASPERGLAGVGLAPAGLAQVDNPDSDDERPGGQHAGRGSRGRAGGDALLRPAPLQLDNQLELSGQSGHSCGKNSSALSEISEDMLDSLSPSASQIGVGGRAMSLGDTLELSATLDASGEASVLDVAPEGGRQSMAEFKARFGAEDSCAGALVAPASGLTRRRIEGEVKSLNRALAMLKEIREKQREYLQLLETAVL